MEPPIPHPVPHGFVTHADLVEPNSPKDDDAPISPDPKRKLDWDDQIESFQSLMAMASAGRAKGQGNGQAEGEGKKSRCSNEANTDA